MKDLRESVRATIYWTREYVDAIGKDKKVVVGISGGRNSAVAAGILEHALGKNRVIGLMIANKELPQSQEYKNAIAVCSQLGIEMQFISMNDTIETMSNSIIQSKQEWRDNAPEGFDNFKVNAIARVRMAYLYSIATLRNALVVNTSDRSSNIIGYTTKFGDQVGDFSPLAYFTNDELEQFGDFMKLPEGAIHSKPTDGLWISDDDDRHAISDEERTGLLYSDVNNLIRNGAKDMDKELVSKITRAYQASMHKRQALSIPTFRQQGLYDYFVDKFEEME